MGTRQREENEEAAAAGGEGGPAAERVTLRSILSDRPVRAVMVATFVSMLGFGMVAPVLPLFARSFDVGYGAAALMVSAYALTRLGLDVVAGPLVRRLGERVSTITGVLVTGVAAALTAAAPTFPLAVAAWALAGAGSAVQFTALYSYLLKVVPNERMGRTLSVFWGSLSVSWIAGAPIGGALAAIGLAVPLWAFAATCMVAGFLYFRGAADPPAAPPVVEETSDGSRVRPLRAMLRMSAFRAVLFVNLGLFWLVAAGISTLAPLFAQRSLDLGTVGISVALTAFVLTELIALYPAGVASDRYGRKWLLVTGLLGLAVTTGVLGLSPGPLAFGLLLAVAGFASGIAGVSPSAMLADLTPPDRSAVSVAAYRFCGDLGYVLGPALAGVTAQLVGFPAAFVVAALPTFLSALFLLPIAETKPLRPTGDEVVAVTPPREPAP